MQERIMQSLKGSPGYLSGEEISRILNISRAGIWKHIQDLRRQGYRIDAVPHLGYRILSSPDKLLPWEIKFGLGTAVIGQNIVYSETVGSTMDEAFQLGIDGAPEGTVVCAETQTKGRGRLGRTWISPSGKGVYVSVILRPQLALPEVSQLTLVCAVALCEAINAVADLKARIKWPNDIFIGGKKIAGILTELNAEMDRVRFVIVGVGINVNALAQQLPPEATSFKLEAKKDFSRVAVLQEFLRSLEKWLPAFQDNGFPFVLGRWKELTLTLGRRVRFTEPRGEAEGVAVDLAPDGGLLVRKDSGEVVKRISGDVSLL